MYKLGRLKRATQAHISVYCRLLLFSSSCLLLLSGVFHCLFYKPSDWRHPGLPSHLPTDTSTLVFLLLLFQSRDVEVLMLHGCPFVVHSGFEPTYNPKYFRSFNFPNHILHTCIQLKPISAPNQPQIS